MTQFNVVQLTQNKKVFAPQTIAEAVLVKQNSTIITLDKVLEKINTKINTKLTADESISITQNIDENSIKIGHTNTITPSPQLAPIKVAVDKNGHITNYSPLETTTIKIEGAEDITIDGSEAVNIQFGNDFRKDNDNNITLHWNNYGNT